MSKKNILVKPYLKWAGGKRQLLSELKKYIPKRIDTYYEPFVGAGALLFELQPKKFIINDANSELIMTYNEIKDNLEALISELEIYTTKNEKDMYYAIRDIDRTPQFLKYSSTQKAARLIYLNKTCYNGLYRVNSQGEFNTPYGFYKSPGICDKPRLIAVSEFLNGAQLATITNGDFKKCVDKATSKDFVYFDPPYHSESRTNFTGYQANGFDETEQKRLFETFESLKKRNVKCMLSNSSTSFTNNLYSDYKIISVKANRAINSEGSNRGPVDEIIVLNWWPEEENEKK